MNAIAETQSVLAIDIGGTKIAGGLVSPDGSIHQPKTVITQAKEGGEVVMGQVIALAKDLLASTRDDPALRPSAVGVGTGGMVRLPEGVISSATSAIPGWGGMPVRERLTQALGLPVLVENDGNAMVLGEAIFGAGKGYPLVLGITVGTGIGGGLAMNGRIFHGAHGFSNHLGHMVLIYNGRLCPCGQRGCLEAYASATAMADDFTVRMGKSRLLSEFGLLHGNFGTKEITGLAAQGVPEAIAALDQGADYLGAGIGSLINIIDPDIVVVGGGAAHGEESYFAHLQAAVIERVLPGGTPVPVVPAGLKNWAGLVGAACVVWEKH